MRRLSDTPLFRRCGMTMASMQAQVRIAATRQPRARGAVPTLAWHFFSCFFAGEQPESVFRPATLAMQIAGGLGVPPALLMLCMIASYDGTMPWGQLRSPWLQAGDHFSLITYTCTVVGMVAVLSWERFLPTLLDARVLAFESRWRLFLAKSLAMGLFLGAFLFGSTVPAAIATVGVANTHHTTHQFLVHLFATWAAGIFTATACMSLLALATLLPSAPRRVVAPLLQAALIAALLLFLFAAPAMSATLPALVGSHSLMTRLAPPFWFTGIYESLLDPDELGHSFASLAIRGGMATLMSIALFTLLYPLIYGRTAQRLLEGDGAHPMRTGSVAAWAAPLLAWYVPQPRQRAAVHLLNAAMLRVQRLRTCAIFAACAGLALAVATMAHPHVLRGWPFVRLAPRSPVAVTFLFLCIAVGVLRLLVSSRLQPKAAWIFDCTIGRADPGISSGIRRWMLAAACFAGAPVLASLLWMLPTIPVTGARLARALVVLVAMCLLLVEMLFHGFREIPFCSPGLRRSTLPAFGLAYLFVILPLSVALLRRVEPALSTNWIRTILLLAAAAAAHVALRQRRSRERPLLLPEEADEEPFQRLGL